MKKTKPIIRVLLGISLIMLISGLYQYFTNVMETKHIIKTCIGIIIPIILYLRNMISRKTLLTSLKDSLPYITVLFLISDLAQVEWMVLVLAAIIFIINKMITINISCINIENRINTNKIIIRIVIFNFPIIIGGF